MERGARISSRRSSIKPPYLHVALSKGKGATTSSPVSSSDIQSPQLRICRQTRVLRTDYTRFLPEPLNAFVPRIASPNCYGLSARYPSSSRRQLTDRLCNSYSPPCSAALLSASRIQVRQRTKTAVGSQPTGPAASRLGWSSSVPGHAPAFQELISLTDAVAISSFGALRRI